MSRISRRVAVKLAAGLSVGAGLVTVGESRGEEVQKPAPKDLELSSAVEHLPSYMFAEQVTVNGNALTREAFAGVLAANVAGGMKFRTVGLSVYGVLLIVHGELTLPEGGAIAQVGILRFDETGSISEFTIVQGPLP